MALNIKNKAVEDLASDIARLTGETKTEAIRRALEERHDRIRYALAPADRCARLGRFLQNEVRPLVPEAQRGRRLTSEEQDAILGYGPEGV